MFRNLSSFGENKGLIAFSWRDCSLLLLKQTLALATLHHHLNTERVSFLSFLPVELCWATLRNSLLPLPPPPADCFSGVSLQSSSYQGSTVCLMIFLMSQSQRKRKGNFHSCVKPTTLMMSMERDFILSLGK